MAVIRQFSDHLSLFSQWTAKPANAIIEATLFIIWQSDEITNISPRVLRTFLVPPTHAFLYREPTAGISGTKGEREERQVGRRRRRAQKSFNC